ncbi:response regulator, partial [bacterium]|nr:response regulator [bacterium]
VAAADAAPRGSLDGYTILVTDDEPDFVTFASAILEDHGARVLQAHSGEEAMETARREMPDLMTLDLSMPGTSGSEVFERMRRDPELGQLPIFIITGQPELRRLIYDRDVRSPEGYLDKPITEQGLLFNIRKALNVPH